MGKRLTVTALVCALLLQAGCAANTQQEEPMASAPSAESVAGSPASTSAATEPSSSEAAEGLYPSSYLDTGNLTEFGTGYEGIEGTGDFNYGEALQKSILFYELQRSGDLPTKVRCNWRGDSGLDDGADNGLDLTGGWYDAGDNVKFNLPMAYSAAMLAWSVYEYGDAYEEAGQTEYILGDIKWVCDYLIKCHPEDEVYYYQVGDPNADHSWWGPAEVMAMSRPSYKVTSDNPGSCVTGEAAAALAAAAIVFEESDPAYSSECLEHAKSLFEFANKYRSDSGYTAANGFYDSWSGFYDELAWAGAWLYLATGEQEYLDIAEECYPQASQDYNWSMCWDDVHIGAAVLLAQITGKDTYTNAVEKHLDWWTTGTADGDRITYTPAGLAWLDSWGSLRYATTTAYIATVYSGSDCCDPSRVDDYISFAEAQCNYALGSSGRSYMVGFGENPPEHPHHRTAQGSYCDNMNEPSAHRHTLYGALVGGPDSSDGYSDDVSNYTNNEVACDYNAGFTGLLAYMYSQYHGQTLKDFGAVEAIDEYEYSVEAAVNASGDDFTEIKAIVYNMTAWPARTATDVEMRYFLDLSEIVEAGGDPSSIEITANYMQSGTVDGLKVWDEENNIYYLSVLFNDGQLYPGGQSQYKSEVQVRLTYSGGPWDPSNDPSYEGLATGTASLDTNIALYEGGNLVFGTEPPAGDNAGQSVVISGASASSGSSSSGSTGSSSASAGGSGESGDLSLSVKYDSSGGNSISGSMEIKNLSDSAISFSGLELKYYLTNDSGSAMTFDCYYAGMNGADGAYSEVKGISGTFEDASGTDTDTCLVMSFPSSGTIDSGATVTVNFSIHYSDWSNMTTSNDYSMADVGNIVIVSGGSVIYGTEP